MKLALIWCLSDRTPWGQSSAHTSHDDRFFRLLTSYANSRLHHHLSVRSLLVAMPGAPSSFLFLAVRPGAPSSVRSFLAVRSGALGELFHEFAFSRRSCHMDVLGQHNGAGSHSTHDLCTGLLHLHVAFVRCVDCTNRQTFDHPKI